MTKQLFILPRICNPNPQLSTTYMRHTTQVCKFCEGRPLLGVRSFLILASTMSIILLTLKHHIIPRIIVPEQFEAGNLSSRFLSSNLLRFGSSKNSFEFIWPIQLTWTNNIYFETSNLAFWFMNLRCMILDSTVVQGRLWHWQVLWICCSGSCHASFLLCFDVMQFYHNSLCDFAVWRGLTVLTFKAALAELQSRASEFAWQESTCCAESRCSTKWTNVKILKMLKMYMNYEMLWNITNLYDVWP